MPTAEVPSDSDSDKDIAAKSRRYLQHPQNLYFLLIERKQVRDADAGNGMGGG